MVKTRFTPYPPIASLTVLELHFQKARVGETFGMWPAAKNDYIMQLCLEPGYFGEYPLSLHNASILEAMYGMYSIRTCVKLHCMNLVQVFCRSSVVCVCHFLAAGTHSRRGSLTLRYTLSHCLRHWPFRKKLLKLLHLE